MTLDPGPNPSENSPLLPTPLPYPRKPNPLRFLFPHNPTFLLSALFMFLGCYLINSALDVRTGDTGKLIALLVTINVYEVALLLLGITLLRRASFNRDGTLLLLIQMLFLTDAPFLLAQSAMASAGWLSIFNLLLLAAGVAKAVFALRALNIPLHPRTLGFLLLQLMLIYCAVPLFLSHNTIDGVIHANPMYLAWWIVGLLPLAYDLLARIAPLPADSTPQQLFLRRAYIIVPWLFLIAHLAFFQYAYRSPFFLADLSPVLLGLAVATLRTRSLRQSDLITLRVVLPALAICFALPADDASALTPTLLTLTPQWLTTGMSLLTAAYCLHINAAAITAVLFSIIALLRHYGPSPSTVIDQLSSFYTSVYNLLADLVPKSATTWGILSIVAAFALLGLGAIRTLRRTPVS
ncbi:MAG TPA: hypothetical protein VM008_18410 [Phycisphaerae bacterium]|nr:hypothetical protein [Phycisphaerae bacterium]